MTQKRLAIQFFGHTRTYEKTYESFFLNIVEFNVKDGWQIDIFIHTWDMSSSSDGSWHNRQDLFDIHLLSQDDIENIRKIYNPKVFLVEHLQEGIHGGSESKKRGNRLRESYEKENSIKYDYILYTRMDILFASPLNIQRYIDLYTKGSMKNFPLPQKHCFAAFNPFVRMPVIDIRYINEGDIVYFTNYPHDEFKPEKRLELFIIMIDYKLHRDFFLQRRDFIHGYNSSLEAKLKIEQDLINKKLKAQILEKELGYDCNAIQENKKLKEQIKALQLIGKENIKQQSIYTAKSRIHNQLSYKLGQAMIENSKSIWGYIRMPYVLSYIKDMHKKEQIAYNEKIKANPNLKLPPLESYPDYKEALKEKECLTYKLGEAMIEASKNWYKGGYVKLWFKCKNIQKECKKR